MTQVSPILPSPNPEAHGASLRFGSITAEAHPGPRPVLVLDLSRSTPREELGELELIALRSLIDELLGLTKDA